MFSNHIMAFFFPSTFEDTTNQTLDFDLRSLYKAFALNFHFHDHSVFRIPIREFSQDWRYQSLPIKSWNTRDFGWIDFKMEEDSSIRFSIPLQPEYDQYNFSMDIDFRMTNVITSVNFAGFASWHRFHLQSKLCSPLRWNGERHWDLNLIVNDAQLYVLKDHIYLLTDLVSDWFWQPSQKKFEMHIPYVYNYTMQFSNMKISFYINECNIIDFPDVRPENSTLMI